VLSDIAELESNKDLGSDTLELIEEVREAVGEPVYLALLEATEYSPSFIISEAKRLDRRSKFRIWQLKQFRDNVEVVDALGQFLSVPDFRFTSAYVLECFFNIRVDLVQAFSNLREIRLTSEDAVRLLNVAGLRAISEGDFDILEFAANLTRDALPKDRIRLFVLWCRSEAQKREQRLQ
jgi:hypothetical protein